jgi:hypothetical protein
MLTSINPLGQRARGHRWSLTVALYVVASVLGGVTTGALVGGLGALLHVPVWVAAVGCAAAAASDVLRPGSFGRRQVDEDWLVRYRSWVYATGYGWQLGTGVVTIVTSASTYAWVLVMLVLGLPGALAVGAAFGLVRALPLLAGRAADSPQALRSLARRLESGRAWAHRLTVLALALSAGALAVTG